jgi:hypothetical protein
MLAFSANSIIARVALRDSTIDPASFSTIRLVSGAHMLLIHRTSTSAQRRTLGGTLGGGILLFLYAVPFFFAYVSLAAGTGALILFGAVQVTMLVAAWSVGERAGLRPHRTCLGGLWWCCFDGRTTGHAFACFHAFHPWWCLPRLARLWRAFKEGPEPRTLNEVHSEAQNRYHWQRGVGSREFSAS